MSNHADGKGDLREQYVRVRRADGTVQRCVRRAAAPIEGSFREDIDSGARYHPVSGHSDANASWIHADDLTVKEALSAGEMSGLAPPTTPTKIVCVGRNYRSHAEELDNPVPEQPLLFLKPPSALIGSGAAVELPVDSEDVQHEGELAVVIGRRCRHVDAERADQVIAGVTAANDVTARDLQNADKLFTRGKGFDTFCPLGPAVTPVHGWSEDAKGELRWELDWDEDRSTDNGAGLVTEVNGETRQRGVFSDFIFPVGKVIAYISRIMTLEPGDVILTGTPSGVGGLERGDEVSVRVDGVGRLTNPVRGGESIHNQG